MKIKFLSIFLLIIFYFFPFTNLFCEIPPGFEVYFNKPTGTSDANSPGLDFRFKNYLASVNNKIIYAAFYDIDNSTAIAALNSALNRGCTVYFICDADATNASIFTSSITTSYKIRTSSGSQVHNKFCVIEGSSVWTGSWNPTNNDTYQNNNNVVVIRSTAVAEIYKNEFVEMYGTPLRTGFSHFGSSKAVNVINTSNNGKTEYVNGVKVKIYFSPYSTPVTGGTNKVIANEIKGTGGTKSIQGAKEKVSFCLFSFTTNSDDSQIYDSLVDVMKQGVEVYGIFDITQTDSQSTYAKLRSTGAYVTYNADASNINYNLHHKFGVIDPFTTNAKVITGSHNWSNSANTLNDENTLVIYSTGIAKEYYEEFQRIYKNVGPISTPSKKAVDKVVVYPSPAKNRTAIGFEISSDVTSVTVKIYTLSGEIAREITPVVTPGVYNEVLWNCDNDDGEKVASGLYILKIEAATSDKTFFAIEKFAVIKGEK
ncbi:MAG: phospholipase D-like domain-containing protein [Elusimicrobiota bacterium]